MRNKYKILVLSDLKSTNANVIKSGISLAKMIDAELQLFHVRKATDIVENESQLSAKRIINRSFLKTSKEVQKIVDPYSKDYNIEIECNHAFGNVKNEIDNFIKQQKPDVVILGKRKSKPLNFIGDNITDFVVKNFKGEIVIASNENALEPNKDLSLGILNDIDNSLNRELSKNLIGHTEKPLKLIKTVTEEKTNKNGALANKELVELLFDYGDNSIYSLSNYLSKSDINLLCMNRDVNQEKKSNLGLKNVMNNLNVNLLIS